MTNQEQQLADARFLGLLRPIEGELENYSRRMVFDSRDFEDALQNAVLQLFHLSDLNDDWLEIACSEATGMSHNYIARSVIRFEIQSKPLRTDFQGARVIGYLKDAIGVPVPRI